MALTTSSVRVWFEIHKWTSLICTVFLLMLCLTGLPLIFYEEIDHLLGKEPEAPVLPEGTPKMNLDLIVAKGQETNPGQVIRYVFWQPDEHPHVVLLSMADSIDAPPDVANFVSLDERTGEVLNQPRFDEGFMYIMYKLHVDMFAGIGGKLFLGLMGLLFVVAIISGLMLYGPIMRKFDFGMIRDKSRRLQWLDLHNLLGVVTVAWALVVGFTGFINTTSEIVLGLWQTGQLSEMVAPYKAAQPLTGKLSSLEEAVKTSQQAAPNMNPSIVAFPGTLFSSEHHYAVFMRGTTPLTSRLVKPALIDAKTGALTDMRDMPWYVNALFISQPLHFGNYGGMPLKIIWTFFDVITIVVLISGLYLWVARRKSREAYIARIKSTSKASTINLEPAQ